MTRTGIALGCLAWLIVMSVPLLALALVANNELAWRRGPQGLEVDKLFLINEPDFAGLGFETGRIRTNRGEGVCVETSVSYLLWRDASDASQNTRYCQCFDPQGAPTESCP